MTAAQLRDALLPRSLAHRFAIVAAGLAAAALLATALASWWLINQQHRHALEELAAKETEFHAAAVASDLHALAERMSEVAGSTILATGLVDSAGRETYLAPFLAGIRQIHGVPVQVLFTDFEGKEIASNGATSFTAAELGWLRRELEAGRPGASIFPSDKGHALVALAPLTYARTRSPEGALMYKFSLADLKPGERMQLEWGAMNAPTAGPTVMLSVPAVFEPLQFRVRGPVIATSWIASLGPQYATIFVIALLMFSAVVLAGRRLAQILTRDLRRLEAFSSRFISSGLSTERAPLAGSTEVAGLAASINQMLDRLHEQHSALLREREKLSVLADALQAADQRKDEFLATLAHELRNPLAPIRNSVTILKAHPLPDPHLARARDIVDRQVEHMARLLDDLLDVSRITRNKLALRSQRVTLQQVVEAAIETSRPLIEASAHELDVDLPAHAVHLDADPLRLAQVFANLVNNAAKYTQRGGHIDITAHVDEGNVVVSVRDDGIGIAPEQLSHIFEMFIQSAPSSDHTHSGLGIGLSLVRGLVELHGGSVGAMSAGPGHGSTFTVRLPVAEAPAEQPALALQPVAARRSRRILVADDNRDAAETLAMMLSLSGHEVKVAHDGQEAIDLAAEYHPDIALLDIGMPRLDGYQVAERIRAEPWGRAVTLIALTGWGQDKDRQRASAAGFDHHLVKPADPEQLQQLLASAHAAEDSTISVVPTATAQPAS